MGMFWRFGSVELSRPVDATAWWKVVCRRPVSRIEQGGQRIDVGALELGVQAPVEQHAHHRVCRPEVLQHRRVGREAGLGAAAAGQVEFVEQHLLQLLGRAQRELVADRFEDLLLQAIDLRAEGLGEVTEGRPVDGDAGGLHVRQDGDQWQLQLVEDLAQRRRLGKVRLQSGSHRRHGQRLDRGVLRAAQLAGLGQLQGQSLGGDVAERLGAQGGVQDVGRDLRVEANLRERAAGCGQGTLGVRVPPGELPHEELLDLVADQRTARGEDRVRKGIRPGRIRGKHAPVTGGHGKPQQSATARPRVVQGNADREVVLPCEPGRQVRGRVERLVPGRVDERGREPCARI